MIDFPILLAAAADLFDVPSDTIRDGRGRSARMVDCRQALAYVLAERQYTTTEIGAILRRDHSTICYALKQARARMQSDPTFAAKVRSLAAATGHAPPTVAATVQARATAGTTITAPLRLALAWWGLPNVRSA
jgi:hypothetical protein